MAIQCSECGLPIQRGRVALKMCEACLSQTPGEAKACPSCGCPWTERVQQRPGVAHWEWIIVLGADQAGPVHYCPEHGCDLEAEFHLALKTKKARRS